MSNTVSINQSWKGYTKRETCFGETRSGIKASSVTILDIPGRDKGWCTTWKMRPRIPSNWTVKRSICWGFEIGIWLLTRLCKCDGYSFANRFRLQETLQYFFTQQIQRSKTFSRDVCLRLQNYLASIYFIFIYFSQVYASTCIQWISYIVNMLSGRLFSSII